MLMKHAPSGSIVLLIMLHLCHVQTARFHQFWDEAAKSRHILEVVPGIWS